MFIEQRVYTEHTLWRDLAREVRAIRGPGTRARINLSPGARREPSGKFLQDALPSYVITDGPIFEICKRLAPNFSFSQVTVNRFVDSKQCEWDLDKNNRGTPSGR